MELLAAFVGAIFGAAVSYWFQHRLWLRDARREAYLDAMSAMDDLKDAAKSYSFGVRRLAQYLGESQHEDLVEWTRDRCREEWERYRAQEDVLRRAEVAIRLVGSLDAQASTLAVQVRVRAVPAHWFEEQQEILEAAERFEDNRKVMEREAERFLSDAKMDLGIDQKLSHRLRRPFRRLRLGAAKLKENLWRSDSE